MIFLCDTGHRQPYEPTKRLCTDCAAQFLLETNERLDNPNISRKSFKTNNRRFFYSIQTADSTRYKSTPRRAPQSDPIFDNWNPRA